MTDIYVATLSAMKPGREYTPCDVMNRMKTKGHRFSEEAVSGALASLTRSGVVTSDKVNGGRATVYQISQARAAAIMKEHRG